MKIALIVNPRSGKRKAESIVQHAHELAEKHGHTIEVSIIAKAGDGKVFAQKAIKENFDRVISAGGDGTLNAIACGLIGSQVPLGIIPLGTGNQLAANLGIPPDVERAVEVAVRGQARAIDIGQLGDGSYFALMAGAGWDAEVMNSCSRELKERWGFGAYLFQGLKRVAAPPSALYRIEVDGAEFEVRAATVLIANAGQLFSSLFPVEVRIAPDTSFQDGLLDICIFAPRTLPDVAAVLWKVARRQYVGDDRMIYLQARQVRIEADPSVVTQVDGDCTGETPLVARAVPGGVSVLLPAPAA